MKRKWTVKTTTYKAPGWVVVPPTEVYTGRYFTRWFMANGVAKRTPKLLASTGYGAFSEVVEITPEIDALI